MQNKKWIPAWLVLILALLACNYVTQIFTPATPPPKYRQLNRSQKRLFHQPPQKLEISNRFSNNSAGRPAKNNPI